MRISDWSSDVCSSDLAERTESALNPRPRRAIKPVGGILKDCLQQLAKPRQRTQKVIQRFGSRLRSLHQCTIPFSHFGFKAVARIGAVLRAPSVTRYPPGGEHGFNPPAGFARVASPQPTITRKHKRRL